MKNFQEKFYVGRDPRELPAYGVVEAARYLHVPEFTLRSWVQPVRFATSDGYCEKPLIERPANSSKLSFLNLIEGHVLKALRQHHNVPVADIRGAIYYAEQEIDIPRLLISPDLRAGVKQLFVKKFGQLINLGRGGQLAMERVLSRYLERIEYQDSLPVSLFPFIAELDKRTVQISPEVAFGKPVVARAGIMTYMIAERFELGETRSEIAKDYGITETEVEEAIIYEAAA